MTCEGTEMNYNIEIDRKNDLPVFAGIFRLLFGLTALLIGLYIAMFTDAKGHGLGLLLVFGAPFIFLKDDK
jgi:hypothetical protein